jgi:hypothetical protein
MRVPCDGADGMLDEPPRVRDGPIITPTVAKSIVGQAGLQLAVMAALLGPLGDTLTHHTAAAAQAAAGAGAAVTDAAVAAAAAVAVAAGADGGAPDRIEQYTLVFNSFVLMQLFNQVGRGRHQWLRVCWHQLGAGERLFQACSAAVGDMGCPASRRSYMCMLSALACCCPLLPQWCITDISPSCLLPETIIHHAVCVFVVHFPHSAKHS